MAQEACYPAEKTATVLRQLCYFLEKKAHDEHFGKAYTGDFPKKGSTPHKLFCTGRTSKKAALVSFADKYKHMAFATSGLTTLLLPRTE
jgi:hypothetical protein